jgi:hypothetical protein
MKKNAIIGLIALVLCICLVVILLIVGGGRENDPTTPIDNTTNTTEPSTSVPNTEDSVPPTTEPIIIPENVHGTPGYMFESTLGREFDFSLQNTKSGEVFMLNNMNVYGHFLPTFFLPEIYGTDENLVNPVVESHKTGLEVRFAKDTDGIFVFGAANDSDENVRFNDCRLVYIAHTAENSDWNLCGISIGMTEDEVLQKLGDTTQQMNTDEGYSLEWYVYQDGHSYWINALLDQEHGNVYKIVLSIDNYPVYAS